MQSLREEIEKEFTSRYGKTYKAVGNLSPDVSLIVDLIDKRLKAIEERLQYQEDKHADNCECNECYTP